MNRTVLLALTATAFALAATGSFAASSQTALSGKITVRATETLKGNDVTDGGVAGTGDFTISGAITDHGTVTDYRTVRGSTATIRRVTVGKKGTITFLITIRLGASSPERWTITSGTKAYKGLHGRGEQVIDSFDSDPALFVLKGTVSK